MNISSNFIQTALHRKLFLNQKSFLDRIQNCWRENEIVIAI